MKNLIKGFVDNGYNIQFGKDEFYWVNINGDAISFEDWNKAEETLLDYLVNEADM